MSGLEHAAAVMGLLGALTLPFVVHAGECGPPPEPTFTVNLPKLGAPPNPHEWDLPAVWQGHPGAADDSITVPNGRPIYALFVSGYGNNAYLDQLMVYDFARHLMNQGAYVHFAWWNNLLAPYMQRPLHYDQSHPGTALNVATDFLTPEAAEDKAVPGENYQFLADAKLLLAAIREHNPEAVIVLVGHSMGGHAVAQLANETDVLIDLVAPIDPVWSRTYPWAGPTFQNADHYNWTRYRATRELYNGYRSMTWDGGPFFGECVPTGPWRQTWADAAEGSIHPNCAGLVHDHGAPEMTFGSNIINLYHRWQHEAKFPYDHEDARLFDPDFPFPPGGSEVQLAVPTSSAGLELGGWPSGGLPAFSCCPVLEGQHWPNDGHGEIIGARGPVPPAPKPLAFRVRTSPECGVGCPDDIWPARTFSAGNWGDPDQLERVEEMQDLETWPLAQPWLHEPYNPSLCRVSQDLITRFEQINKPPVAVAGDDQVIECTGCGSAVVTLDASRSLDPDPDVLQYAWMWNFGSASGPMVDVEFPLGTHCITLQVTDQVGHIAMDTMLVTVVDPASAIVPFVSAAGSWMAATGSFTARAFDEFFPGLANDAGCLLEDPLEPATLQLDGGTLTVTALDDGDPSCAITDSGTAPALSDTHLKGTSGLVIYEFDPPVTAFYTFFGSAAVGQTVTMHLFGDDGFIGSLTTPPSNHNVLAAGLGFTAAAPVTRIEFTTEPEPVLIGAFVGLQPGEPSLGTVDLGNYPGPNGSGVVERDFACTFAPPACPADLTGDAAVDVGDLLELLGAWGPCDDCAADLTDDDAVDVADLLQLLSAWGACG